MSEKKAKKRRNPETIYKIVIEYKEDGNVYLQGPIEDGILFRTLMNLGEKAALDKLKQMAEAENKQITPVKKS